MALDLTPQRATPRRKWLKLFLYGPSGSGKTFTALKIAAGIASKLDNQGICVIDTENGSSREYAEHFEFDVVDLPQEEAKMTVVEKLIRALAKDYGVVVYDGSSPTWQHTLDMVTDVTEKSKSNNKYAGWRAVTPIHNRMLNAINSAPAHTIATARAKEKHIMRQNKSTGKIEVVPIGIAPVQRDDFKYEFDLAAIIDTEHTLTVVKARDPDSIIEGTSWTKPGDEFLTTLLKYLKLEGDTE